MKLKYLIFLILILNIIFVSAEEFNLQKNKIINYKEVSLNLISVGSSKTIRLQINGKEKLIENNKEILLYDLKIKNLDADYIAQTAKVDLKLTAECLLDEDCESLKPEPCMSYSCNFRNCEFTKTEEGCAFKNECKSIGSFKEVNNKLSFCSLGGSWRPRKPYKEECNSNYECLSNLCDNKKCDKLLFGGNQKMAPAWILIVIGGILLAEALFLILKTKLAKRIIKNASFFTERTWKIIGYVELAIALALIIWALS